jgi:hypothetical protein
MQGGPPKPKYEVCNLFMAKIPTPAQYDELVKKRLAAEEKHRLTQEAYEREQLADRTNKFASELMDTVANTLNQGYNKFVAIIVLKEHYNGLKIVTKKLETLGWKLTHKPFAGDREGKGEEAFTIEKL